MYNLGFPFWGLEGAAESMMWGELSAHAFCAFAPSIFYVSAPAK
jgi:hypothetical protein